MIDLNIGLVYYEYGEIGAPPP